VKNMPILKMYRSRCKAILSPVRVPFFDFFLLIRFRAGLSNLSVGLRYWKRNSVLVTVASIEVIEAK